MSKKYTRLVLAGLLLGFSLLFLNAGQRAAAIICADGTVPPSRLSTEDQNAICKEHDAASTTAPTTTSPTSGSLLGCDPSTDSTAAGPTDICPSNNTNMDGTHSCGNSQDKV